MSYSQTSLRFQDGYVVFVGQGSSKKFYGIITKAFYPKNLFELCDNILFTGSPNSLPDCLSYEAQFPMTHRCLGYLTRRTAVDGYMRYYRHGPPPLSMVKALRLRKVVRYLPHHVKQWQILIQVVLYHCTLKKLVIAGMGCTEKDPSAIRGKPELVQYTSRRLRSKQKLEVFVPRNRELENRIKTQAQAQISHHPENQPTEATIG